LSKQSKKGEFIFTADIQRRCRQAVEHTIVTNEWRARAMSRWLES
jgi:hypothetical protein